jgi:hypothetical protein
MRKDWGNKLFAEKKYTEAMQKYEQGFQVIHSSSAFSEFLLVI